MDKNNKVSIPVIRRLPRYLRYVNMLESEGVKKVSSRELAELLGTTASQVRQDFNLLGGLGRQGIGYPIDELKRELEQRIYAETPLDCILIGAGSLGSAIARYLKNVAKGYNLIGIFDNSEEKVGAKLEEYTCLNIDTLSEFCINHNPVVAVLCVPTSAAEQMVPELIKCGIKNFWNFSHYNFAKLNDDVKVENVHIRESLEALSYRIKHEIN